MPVLALALVIETRTLVARWNRKKFKRHVGRRWLLGLLYSAIVLPLPYVMITAITNTASKATNRADYVVVSAWILGCTLLVVYMPAWRLLSVALADLAQAVADFMPWSGVRRVRRRALRLDEDYGKAIRETRAIRMDGLSRLGEVYVELVGQEIALDRQGRVPREIQAQLAEIHVRLDGIWATLDGAKKDLRALEKRRRNSYGEVDSAISKRRRDTLRDMNRQVRELLDNVSG